jgi:hypothetical protein
MHWPHSSPEVRAVINVVGMRLYGFILVTSYVIEEENLKITLLLLLLF